MAVFSAIWVEPCLADTLLIDRPGAHPNYSFEAEPHVLLGFIDPPGFGHGQGYGVGFRGTLELVDNGFVRTINNTVGIGFGIDFAHYGRGPGRDQVAVDNVWLPLVMQWNFWLSRDWSVFGEPGAAIRFESREGSGGDLHVEFLQLYLGGRYHFADDMALTMRLGYPTFSVGVSFLL